MSINEEQIKHIAKLSKLSIDETDLSVLTEQMSNVLSMFDELSTVDTTDVPVTYQVVDETNVWREDVAEKGTNPELLFKNVRESKGNLIKVPAMIDNGEGGA